MKKILFFLAALVGMTLAGCIDEKFVGDLPPSNTPVEDTEAIQFGFNLQNMTRTGEFVGATAAKKLGGMFVVEGTKGTEKTKSPSDSVVFDNYLVGYTANTAGTTESNTNNWEYVGLQSGITGRMTGGTGSTWAALHPAGTAQAQSVKYWDYTHSQYDFIAWSTGELEAVTDAAVAGSKIKVTRINTGTTLANNGFTMTAMSANDLLQCYYTDINTVTKASGGYGKPVTLTFKNMAAKVRVALYETVPGYSVKDVKFYTKEANTPTAPDDLGNSTVTDATLFTTGSDVLPQSGNVLVYYPHIGKDHRDATPSQTKDYNKASVTVSTVDGGATSTTQDFGALTNQYTGPETGGHEATGNIYLGRTLPNATYAGSAAENYYTAVIPNTNAVPLTLRVDYTLVATDGSGETINVYGAKAVVPSTYTVWQPNYAYTYIFKISDNSNGWTSKTNTDPQGLFPITFDAMVASFIDANAEQTTVTTVATPSITTYQQGHDHKNKDEYSKTQKAGKDTENYKDLYVQVMDNSTTTPSLASLTASNSLFFSVATTTGTPISEASVMDALQNRTNTKDDPSPVGRNGITLTTNANIAVSAASGTFNEIVNGVDDNPISVGAGEAAKIDIDNVGVPTGTYAFVYVQTAPTADEKVYHVAAATSSNYANYYKAGTITAVPDPEAPATTVPAEAGKVYFVKNTDAVGGSVTYTFKQTKVGENVAGLFVATIPPNKASDWDEHAFYFDVYNQNNGKYAVKVIKVVN